MFDMGVAPTPAAGGSEGGKVIVALPVRDEEALILPCLEALRRQTRQADFILLLLNNCRDGSREALLRAASGAGQLLVVEAELPLALACAGEARRLALNLAAGLAPDGALLTSDADAVVPGDWIEANLAQLAAGADMVCGQARIRPEDLAVLPGQLLDFLEAEAAYLAVLDEIAALLDPDPADPWPRHQQRSGASLAMRLAAYRRAGGAPSVRSGEDRALVAAFRRVDARVRHAPEIAVDVSGRLQGRAPGGMAETLRRRVLAPEAETDARLEPLAARLRRLRARAALRAAWMRGETNTRLARRLGLTPASMEAALRQSCFGTAWALVQAQSPNLRRVVLPGHALPGETARAARLRDALRAGPAPAQREVLACAG